MKNNREHIPVLLKEVLDSLGPLEGKKYIDATFGFGGHTEAIQKAGGKVLAIDWDPEIISLAKKRHPCPGASCQLIQGNFAEIKFLAEREKFAPVDGILFDLGISRWHYKKGQRGFSFEDSNLDMRLNPEIKEKAFKIINSYSLNKLNEVFTKLVQEKLAEPIAQALVSARRLKPIKSAKELAGIIEKVYQKIGERTRFHPATKVFLALRMVVNQELKNLEKGLNQGWQILKTGGKVLVITFHSTEDRIVKNFAKEKEKTDQGKSKICFPSEEEIKKNYLARSAKLRIIQKIV